MKVNTVIHIISADIEQSANWLVFDAFASCFDVNKKYKIRFCGTELLSAIPLTEAQMIY
jgi:hypothetical protein